MSETDTKADCYSAGERDAMQWTQRLRASLLGPLLRVLAWIGVKPNHITYTSMLFGLAFCPLFFWSPQWAFIALLLHVLLDGVDGPLARHLNIDSPMGSMTDTMVDQVVVAATTITLMSTEPAVLAPWCGGLYIFLYTVVVIFAMIRNTLNIPYAWLVRPRFVVYVWSAVEVFWLGGTLDYVVAGFNLLLLINLTTGFVSIRRSLS